MVISGAAGNIGYRRRIDSMFSWITRWLDGPYEYVTLEDGSRVMVNEGDLRLTWWRNDPTHREWQAKLRAGPK